MVLKGTQEALESDGIKFNYEFLFPISRSSSAVLWRRMSIGGDGVPAPSATLGLTADLLVSLSSTP